LQSSSGEKLDRKKTDGKIDKEEVGRGGGRGWEGEEGNGRGTI
jgi:hypothetical protein